MLRRRMLPVSVCVNLTSLEEWYPYLEMNLYVSGDYDQTQVSVLKKSYGKGGDAKAMDIFARSVGVG